MTSTAPSTKRLESSTPSETAIRWPTTELLLSLKCIGPPRRVAHCARPCQDAEHRLAPVTLRGLLDSTDTRRSAEGRAGQMDGPLSHSGRALAYGPAGAPWSGPNRT